MMSMALPFPLLPCLAFCVRKQKRLSWLKPHSLHLRSQRWRWAAEKEVKEDSAKERESLQLSPLPESAHSNRSSVSESCGLTCKQYVGGPKQHVEYNEDVIRGQSQLQQIDSLYLLHSKGKLINNWSTTAVRSLYYLLFNGTNIR